MNSTQINTVDTAYNTALLCLEYNQNLTDLTEALVECSLQSAGTHMGPDWFHDPNNWSSVDEGLVKSLKAILQDHVRVPPLPALTYTLGETLAKDEYRDQWEGLTDEEVEEVWYEIADYLLSSR